jgi:hypothetical protein
MTGEGNTTGTRASWLGFLLVAIVFLGSRMLLLPGPQPTSDVGIYAQYAHEYEAASRQGVSFYDFHAQAEQEKAEAARAAGTLVASIDEYKDVEYPPLALAVMRLPELWMQERPAGGPLTPAFVEDYRSAYRLGMAVVDAILFALLVLLVRRLFAQESVGEQTQRLLVYVASTILLWHLLYDRLDLLLTLMLVFALFLLISRLHYAYSFAVLACAINFKLVPLILVPVWIAGSLRGGERLTFAQPRVVADVGIRMAVLCAMVVGWFLPFYLAEGNRCLGFLAYHRARGLEIGSVSSSLLFPLQALGQPIDVEYSYGSINVRSSLSPLLVALAPWLAAGLLLGGTILLVVHVGRLSAQQGSACLAFPTLAQNHPGTFICYTLLFLLLFLVTNKVLSPQYLLWLAPFVCLLPSHWKGRRLLMWLFILICMVSTILVPFLFISDLVDLEGAQTVPRTFKNPSVRVAILLVFRNLVLVGLTVAQTMYLFGQMRNLPAMSGESNRR